MSEALLLINISDTGADPSTTVGPLAPAPSAVATAAASCGRQSRASRQLGTAAAASLGGGVRMVYGNKDRIDRKTTNEGSGS